MSGSIELSILFDSFGNIAQGKNLEGGERFKDAYSNTAHRSEC